MYVVLGITGNTGAAAAAALLDAGQAVRALVRDPDKAAAVLAPALGVELLGGRRRGRREPAGAVHGRRWRLSRWCRRSPRTPTRSPGTSRRRRPFATRAAAPELPRLVFPVVRGRTSSRPARGRSAASHEAERILRDLPATRVTLSPSDLLPGRTGRRCSALAAGAGILPTFLTDVDKRRAMVAAARHRRDGGSLLLDPGPPALVELDGDLEPYSARDRRRGAPAAVGREVAPVVRAARSAGSRR